MHVSYSWEIKMFLKFSTTFQSKNEKNMKYRLFKDVNFIIHVNISFQWAKISFHFSFTHSVQATLAHDVIVSYLGPSLGGIILGPPLEALYQLNRHNLPKRYGVWTSPCMLLGIHRLLFGTIRPSSFPVNKHPLVYLF